MNRVRLIGTSLVALLLLFLLTDPNRLPSAILITPFLLVFIIVFILAKTTADHYTRLASKIRFALAAAALPTLLLVLRSLGQLTIRDFITVIVFFGIAYFYLGRTAGMAKI